MSSYTPSPWTSALSKKVRALDARHLAPARASRPTPARDVRGRATRPTRPARATGSRPRALPPLFPRAPASARAPALTASFLDPSASPGSIEISIKHPVHLFTTENARPWIRPSSAFFITASKADTALPEADISKGGCLLDDLDHTLVLFTFADMQEHLNEEGDEYKFSYTIADGKQGEYSLYYTNCVPNTAVSFDIQVELFNPTAGRPKDYGSAGERPLPTLYMLAFFVYAAVGAAWAYTLTARRTRNPGACRRSTC